MYGLTNINFFLNAERWENWNFSLVFSFWGFEVCPVVRFLKETVIGLEIWWIMDGRGWFGSKSWELGW